MEGIQKDIILLQDQMLELQLMTGIQTKIEAISEENDYHFTLKVKIDNEFEDALKEASFDHVMCFLCGMTIGNDIGLSNQFKRISNN